MLAGSFLYVIYEFDIKRLLETLLQWAFAVAGFKILVDYSLIKGIFSEEKIDSTIGKLPILRNMSFATKKFKYNYKK